MPLSNRTRYRKFLTIAVIGTSAIAAAWLIDYLMTAYISPQPHSAASAPYVVAVRATPRDRAGALLALVGRPPEIPGRQPASMEAAA